MRAAFGGLRAAAAIAAAETRQHLFEDSVGGTA